MLKIRLKRCGRKLKPTFRIIVITDRAKRDGEAIKELGFYNPIKKEIKLDIQKTLYYLKIGVKPSKTVQNLLLKTKIIN